MLEAAVEANNARDGAVRGDILDGGAAGVRSTSVIAAARNLEAGSLRLPRSPMAVELPVVTLGTVAERGLVDRGINGDFTNSIRAWRRGWTCRGSSGAPSHPCMAGRPLESMHDRSPGKAP